MKLKIIFTGSRDLTKEEVYNILNKYDFDYIFFGDCKTGGDFEAKNYVIENKIDFHKPFVADWGMYGLKAGPIRNERMVKYVKRYYHNIYGIAIRKNKSRGTSDCIRAFLRYEMNYKLYEIG